MKNFAPNATARVLSVALRLVPRGGHVFVHGIPGSEGNIVEVVRALVRLTDRPIVWPGAPDADYLKAIGVPTHRIRRLPSTQSFSAMWSYLRARAIFHTHGLYGDPVPAKGKPIVNIWHGDSFKGGLLFPERTLKGPSATHLVSSSRLIGKIKADRTRLPADRLLVVGNPRIVQLYNPPNTSQLEALGINPDRPFVLWMPTFRIARSADGSVAWTNTANPDGDHQLADRASEISRVLQLAGIDMVVKPHRLDATSRAVPGTIVLDEEMLDRNKVPLYSLIGASAGLISDYSSVWIDYLALDKPLGFLVDDLDDFRQSRAITAPELIDQYPGLRLDSTSTVEAFAEDVKAGGVPSRALRADFKELIGYVASESTAEDLIREVFQMPRDRTTARGVDRP